MTSAFERLDPPAPRSRRAITRALERAADSVEQSRSWLMDRIRRVAPLRRRAVLHGAVIGGYVGFLLLLLRGTDPFAYDACAYWAVDLAQPYAGAYGMCGFFNYSPAAALAFQPLGQLPWPVFAIGWSGLLLLTLIWMGGRATIVLLAFPAIAGEIWTGNIHLLLAAAMVIGFRYPASWTVILLTKITPGVGLVWFAVRREWRSLIIALGTTAAIVLLTWLILPQQWSTWVGLLQSNAGTVPELVPLWLRVPLAALIIAWGAHKNAPWTVPLGATIAVPVMYLISFSMLAACWPLRHGLPKSS